MTEAEAAHRECGVLLGERLVYLGGRGIDAQFRRLPHLCSKPAKVPGPDGVVRCVQHDRIARGLSGKYPPREQSR